MELPKQFIQSIQQVKGFNEEAFIQVHTTEQQVTSIRINPEKKNIVQHLPIESALPWCNNGYYLTHRPSFTLDPLFHAGTYYVQEASSMFLWKIMQQIFPSNTAKKVLDVCAAPGGKSTLLSSYFSNGLVVSNEVLNLDVVDSLIFHLDSHICQLLFQFDHNCMDNFEVFLQKLMI